MTEQMSVREWVFVLVLVCAAAATPRTHAEAVPDLGAAGQFVILGLEDGSVIINSATSIQGDVGYADGVASTTNQKAENFAGTAYVHSGATFSYEDKNFLPTGGVQIGSPGGVIDMLLEQAHDDALSASAGAAALTPTHTEAEIGGPLSNSSALQQAMVHRKGTLNVINLALIDFKEDTITITGMAGDFFVFNITGNVGWDNSQIILDGVTPDHVLFNFPNASTVDINKSGTIWNGTILAPTGSVEYHNPATFNGAIIALHIDVHSDFNTDQQTFASSNNAAIPAPGLLPSLALLLTALACNRRAKNGVT